MGEGPPPQRRGSSGGWRAGVGLLLLLLAPGFGWLAYPYWRRCAVAMLESDLVGMENPGTSDVAELTAWFALLCGALWAWTRFVRRLRRWFGLGDRKAR